MSFNELNQIKQMLTHYVNLDEFEVSTLQTSSLGNGLINQTYLVCFIKNRTQIQWVLQKINQTVFSSPEHITENADKINQYLIQQKQQNKYPFTIPNHVLALNGKSLVKFKNEYWRAMEYVPHSFSIEKISNNNQAEMVANAYASFAAALASFPAQSLHTIIPDFLNLNARIKQLNIAMRNASPERLKKAEVLCEIPIKYQSFISEVNQVSQSLPLRTVHHDTKINNLLFSKNTQNVTAVIDLDTCMQGYFMYDFGDMVRSSCSTQAEDSTEFKEISLNIELFKVIAQAYIDPLRSIMTPEEYESLVIGVILLPLILGIRFLTDYLNNDLYFKINYDEHNIDRAMNQLTLFQHLLTQRNNIKTILYNVENI